MGAKSDDIHKFSIKQMKLITFLFCFTLSVNEALANDPGSILPDTLYINVGDSVNIFGAVTTIGEWSGTEDFNKLSDTHIRVSPSQQSTYYLKTYTFLAVANDNSSFEAPVNGRGVRTHHHDKVPGWKTTATDSKIEMWRDAYGVSAYQGSQFVELNATMVGDLYQDINTTPGDDIIVEFAHRGRAGPDRMGLKTGPPGGPYRTVGEYTDGTAAWGVYREIVEIPAGQTRTRIFFTSNGFTNSSVGNFLDAVSYTRTRSSLDSVVVMVEHPTSAIPVLTSGARVSLAENTVFVQTVKATDADGETLTYSLTGGSDRAQFSLDGTTGALSFLTAPDFESPSDVGRDNIYEVEVTATDNSVRKLSASQKVFVSVTNANEAPRLTSATSVSIVENTTFVQSVSAVDIDAGTSLTYSLSGGADRAQFSLDGTTGALSFLSAPDFESPSDVGRDNVYEVEVSVTDDGVGALSDSHGLVVSVTNANEAPRLTSATSVSIVENTTFVQSVSAVDTDAGTSLTYSLSGGADRAQFSLDGTTGALSFLSAPDFESPSDVGRDNVYEVEVSVTDDGVGALSDSHGLVVSVTNANEAPRLTSATSVSIVENTTFVQSVSAVDTDAGTSLTYSLSGGADRAQFSLDGTTGALSFLSAPDFESPSDVGRDNFYEVEVSVTDDGVGALSDSYGLVVSVTNANESPSLTSATSVSIVENTTFVQSVSAVDVDAGTTLTYSLSGGSDRAQFSLDGTTGALSFLSAPDFESPSDVGRDNVYEVEVSVTDDGVGTLKLEVPTEAEWTDEMATWASGNQATAAYQSPLKLTVAGFRDAGHGTLDDVGTQGHYWSSESSGTNDFALARLMNLSSSQAFMTDNVRGRGHSVRLIVDGAMTQQKYDQTYLGKTIDYLGITYGFCYNPITGRTWLDRNLGAKQVATRVNDNDSYGDLYQWGRNADGHQVRTAVVYRGSLPLTEQTNGEWNGKFILTNTFPQDWLNTQNSDLWTEALWMGIHVGAGHLSFSHTLSVKVINANEAPHLISDASVSLAENITFVQTVRARDVDPETTLTYSLTGGADQAKFSIDGASGKLSFNSAPDFELPLDLDFNNLYEVEVSVEDDGTPTSSDTHTLSVKVIDANDAPILTSETSVSVFENQSFVQKVKATDPEGDLLTYSLTGGADQAKFSIDGASGKLSFNSAPEFDSPRDVGLDNVYDVEVTVTDNGTSTLKLRIPTEADWTDEIATWASGHQAEAAFHSELKLPLAGSRDAGNGSLYHVGSQGSYWSSSVSGSHDFALSRFLNLSRQSALMTNQVRGRGQSVRLIVEGSFTLPQYTSAYQGKTIRYLGLTYGFCYNATTGRIWLDRNLGAIQVATALNDNNSYGDLYQWGRDADGHQVRASNDNTTQSSMSETIGVGEGKFILTNTSPYDWSSKQDNSLWSETQYEDSWATTGALSDMHSIAVTLIQHPMDVASPVKATLHDDGDGIADSLFIQFDREVSEVNRFDSLRVYWGEDSTTYAWSEFRVQGHQASLSQQEFSRGIYTGLQDQELRANQSSLKLYYSDLIHQTETKLEKVTPLKDKVGPVILDVFLFHGNPQMILVEYSERVKDDFDDERDALIIYQSKSIKDREKILPYQDLDYLRNSSKSEVYQAENLVSSTDSIRLTANQGLMDWSGNRPHVNNPYVQVKSHQVLHVKRNHMAEVPESEELDGWNEGESSIGIEMVDPRVKLSDIPSLTGRIGTRYAFDFKSFTDDFKNIDPSLIVMNWRMNVYTSQGGFVDEEMGQVPCYDPLFEGGCVEENRTMYVGWNMVDANNRKAGTGAYIARVAFTLSYDGQVLSEDEEVWTFGVRRIED